MSSSEARTVLPRRPLGRSGEQITEAGFGAWAAGGGGWAFGWGEQDDADSVAAIVHAVNRGTNWVDTASVYGYGHSEEVVGQALRRIPAGDRPLVFSKCGLEWYDEDRYRSPRRSLEPKLVRRQAEESMRRLGVDQIDLYQFHWPDETGVPAEESWGEMARLVEEGKVRLAGVSNYPVELLERIEPIHHVDSLQPPFSMINRGAAAELLPWALRNGTGIIVYSPMASGLLTGAFSRERVASLSDDWRSRGAEFQEPNLSRNLALVTELRPIAARLGMSLPELAVAWVLAWPGVTGAIVGARTPEQVDGWIEAPLVKLTDADLEEIAQALVRTGAGQGLVRP